MSDPADQTELLQAIIDDHRRRPRHRGPLPAANRVTTTENPLCGDTCTLHLQVERGRILAAHFTGAGCALSQASASLATTALAGLTLADASPLIDLAETLIRAGQAPAPAPALESLGDLAALTLAHRLPARHACALLAWQAARAGLDLSPR